MRGEREREREKQYLNLLLIMEAFIPVNEAFPLVLFLLGAEADIL